MRDYPTTIAEAAKQLDDVHPAWVSKINLEELDMRSGTNCILGQLYGTFDQGLKLYNASSYSVVGDAIFGVAASVSKWKEQIAMRTHDIYWAMQQLAEGKRVKRPKTAGYFLKGERLCSDNVQEITLPYSFLAATDWSLDESVPLHEIEQGKQFVFEGVTYTRYQQQGPSIYVSDGSIVKLFNVTLRVQRG